MLTNVLSKLLGDVAPGQRKFMFCAGVEALLFVFLQWGPAAIVQTTAPTVITSMVTVAGLFVGGNVGEYLAKRGQS